MQGVGAYTKDAKKLEQDIQDALKRVNEKTGALHVDVLL